jgi:hypothetical protein
MTNDFIYLNNDPMVKKLFLKHGVEKMRGIETFAFAS